MLTDPQKIYFLLNRMENKLIRFHSGHQKQKLLHFSLSANWNGKTKVFLIRLKVFFLQRIPPLNLLSCYRVSNWRMLEMWDRWSADSIARRMLSSGKYCTFPKQPSWSGCYSRLSCYVKAVKVSPFNLEGFFFYISTDLSSMMRSTETIGLRKY